MIISEGSYTGIIERTHLDTSAAPYEVFTTYIRLTSGNFSTTYGRVIEQTLFLSPRGRKFLQSQLRSLGIPSAADLEDLSLHLKGTKVRFFIRHKSHKFRNETYAEVGKLVQEKQRSSRTESG